MQPLKQLLPPVGLQPLERAVKSEATAGASAQIGIGLVILVWRPLPKLALALGRATAHGWRAFPTDIPGLEKRAVLNVRLSTKAASASVQQALQDSRHLHEQPQQPK